MGKGTEGTDQGERRARSASGRRWAGLALAAILVLAPAVPVDAQRLNFRTYDNVDGLPQVQARAVFQDRHGYMWFGTYGGVARYDGRDFEAFTTADGLAGNVVQAIAEDAGGRLLIGTLKGLSLHDGESFTDVRMPDGAPIEGVNAIFAEPHGAIWVATERGLVRLGAGAPRRYGVADGLPSATTLSVYRTNRADLLVGTDAGLAVLEQESFSPVAAATLGRVPVRAIIEDEGGSLWVGTDDGLFRAPVESLEGLQRSSHALASRAAVNVATRGSDGLLWFGTHDGVLRWDRERLQLLTRAAGLTSGNVLAVWVDREANVWLGTDGGVSKLVPGPFANYTTLDGLPNDFVRDVAEDPAGRIWLATRGGMAVVEPDGRIRGLGPGEGITETHGFAVEALEDGSILYGTLTGLVHWRDGWKTVYTQADGLPNDAVTALLLTRSGDVLVGTRSGVVRWAGGARASDAVASSAAPTRASFSPIPALAELYVIDLDEDGQGRVWLSSLNGGLHRWDRQRLEHLDGRYGLDGFTVWSLARDGDDGMWLGTNGLGAFHVRGDEVRRLSMEEGLVNDFVWQVLVDSRGGTWFYTNRGLDRWDGEKFRHYDVGDGLLDLEGSLDAGLQDSRGQLWFGSGSGVLRYDPSRSGVPAVPPLVAIRTVTTDGERVPILDGRVSVPAGNNSLSLSFAGLTFRDERNTVFRYRLRGLERDWSRPTREQSISFARLPPGEYTFEVEARNPGGIWSRAPASVRLEVAPTLLQTVWVRLLTVPAVLLLVMVVYGVRHRRLNREKQRLATLVAERTKDLAQSEQRFRTALENSSTSVFHQDVDLRYTWAYSRWDFLQADTILGKTDEEVWSPEAASILTELKRLALSNGEGVRQQVALPTAKSTRYFHVAFEPSRDALGDVIGLTCAMIDETESHELEWRLHRSQKMEAVGQLAGGIAHDFNNLLTGISGYTELALMEVPEDAQLATDLQEVRGLCARAADLTQQLLAFGRRQSLDPVVLDVSELVESSSKMLRRLIREDIELEVRTRARAPVKADRGQLEQVLMNLIVNARDALPDGGRMTITTERTTLDADAALLLEAEPGPHAVMAVADNGVGMDATTREKIFEPFFTTKDVDKGTGLGLATAYGIVRQHGGAVDVESAPGRGTVFRIYLPIVEGRVDETDAPETVPDTVVGAEMILVVEDNDAVRTLAARGLEQAGYRVLVADGPDEALRLYEERGDEVDLLLTDVVMPGCSGTDLWDKLSARGADCPVVFMSGYPDLKEQTSAKGYAGAPVLPKPFSPGSLRQTVRLALDGSTSRRTAATAASLEPTGS